MARLSSRHENRWRRRALVFKENGGDGGGQLSLIEIFAGSRTMFH